MNGTQIVVALVLAISAVMCGSLVFVLGRRVPLRDFGRYGVAAALATGVIVAMLGWAISGLGPTRTAEQQSTTFVATTAVVAAISLVIFGDLVAVFGRLLSVARQGLVLSAWLTPFVLAGGTFVASSLAAGIDERTFEAVQDAAPFVIAGRDGLLFNATLVSVDRQDGDRGLPTRFVIDLRIRTTGPIKFAHVEQGAGGYASPLVCFSQRRVSIYAQGPCWMSDVPWPVPDSLPAGYDRTTRLTFTPPAVGAGPSGHFDLWLQGSSIGVTYETYGARDFVLP